MKSEDFVGYLLSLVMIVGLMLAFGEHGYALLLHLEGDGTCN